MSDPWGGQNPLGCCRDNVTEGGVPTHGGPDCRWPGGSPKHRKGPEDHTTPSNPNGEVRRCDRRDLHAAHEWQAEFGAYFNVYCPGNDGTQR